jgi:hypothetical protein
VRSGKRGGQHHTSSDGGGRGPARAAVALIFALLAPLVIAALLLGAGGISGAAPQTASDTSTATGTTAPGGVAVDPEYPYAGYLRSTITTITPTVVTATGGNLMTVSGTITNVSKGTVYDLRYVWQRGDALSGVTAIKAQIASPSRPDAVVGQNWAVLSAEPAAKNQRDLAAGASMRYVATVAINDRDGLAIGQRGVYPLMIKISGDIGQNGVTRYERVGEIHLLATVLSIPPDKSTARPGQPSTLIPGRPSTIVPSQPSTIIPIQGGGAVTAEDGSSTAAGATGTGSSTATTTDIPTEGLPQPVSSPAAGSPLAAASGVTASGAVTPTSAASTTAAVSTTTAAPGPAGGASAPVAVHPVALNLLWPLVDTPHVGIGGIFLDDQLAKELMPGGRLDQIVSDLVSLNTGASSTTVVLDPELIDEIEQMSGGYRVVSPPGTRQAPLTPTSGAPTTASTAAGRISGARPTAGTLAAPTSSSRGPAQIGPSITTTIPPGTPPATAGASTSTVTTPPPANTVAGTGQHAAITFLAKFRRAIAGQSVLVLPYSDPDSVAMLRAGLNVQLANLIASSRLAAARLLKAGPSQPPPVTNLSYPANEALDDATLAFLSSHGMTRALLSPLTMRHAGGAVGAVTIDESANSGRSVKAAVTDADVLPQIFDLIKRGAGAGAASRVNNLAAVLAGGSFDGTGTPLIIAPDKRWTADTAGLGLLSSLLRTLQTGGVLSGSSLTGIADQARTSATIDYPASAQDAELNPAYLADVLQTTNWINGVRSSLTRAAGDLSPVPADILGPLAAGMTSLGSAGLRTNNRVGRSILATTRATLTGLQSGVAIAGGNSYLLASSASPLLITVRNDLPYVTEVRLIVIGGESVGLTATDPGLQKIPAGRSQQFKINTEVVKAGKFPLNVQVRAADGSAWSAPVTITVSSSAYGTLTIVLIAVAGGALFLMVAIRIVQRVRSRGRPGDPPPDPAANADVPVPGVRPAPDSILGAADAPPGPVPAPPPNGLSSNPSGPDASSQEATGAPRGDDARPEDRRPRMSTDDPGENAP